MALTQAQIDANTALFASQNRNPDGTPKTPFIGSKEVIGVGNTPGLLQYGETTQTNPSLPGTRQELFTPGATNNAETTKTTSTSGVKTNVPTSPSVITADTAQTGVIDPLQAQIDEQNRILKEREAQIQQSQAGMLSRAEQNQQTRMKEQAKQDNEELLTAKAGQFKFGQAGTKYADAATQKIKETQAAQMSIMENQYRDTLAQSQQLLMRGDIRGAEAALTEAGKQQKRMVEEKQAARQAESDILNDTIKKLQIQKATREESQAVGESVAPQIFKDLENDPNADYNELVTKYGNAYGIDPVILSGQIMKVQQENQKTASLNSKQNIDYLSSLADVTGKSFTTTLPGVGEVTIKPKGDYSIIQQKGGNLVVFDKNTGTVTKSSFTSSELSSESLLKTVNDITKPTVAVDSDGKVIPAIPPEPPETFEKFLGRLEEDSKMSFSPELRKAAEQEYNALYLQKPSVAPAGEKDISSYSFAVQQVIKGYSNTSDLLKGGTAGERAKYSQELKKAQTEGLLQQEYSPKQKDTISKINQDVSNSQTYKKTTSMRGYIDNVAASLSQATGVGDIAAINQFQKVIDEGAVTRDQDVRLLQDSQSLVNTLKTKLKKLEKGEQLSPTLRTQMRTAAEALYKAQVSALNKDPYIKAKLKELDLNNLKKEDTILSELENF